MAKTRLSTATYVERGYGQVEPNHFSFQHTGQIYAQLPAAAAITVLENGQYAKYDYANAEVNFTGSGEWLLVFNEVKLYRDYEQYDDFAMLKTNYTALGGMVPRMCKTNVGDIYTTNTVKEAALAVGDTLVPDTDGFLIKDATPEGMTWEVVKVYTLADGQKAVKLVRIA